MTSFEDYFEDSGLCYRNTEKRCGMYTCVSPRSTMVLFSVKNREPLAALVVLNGEGASPLLTARTPLPADNTDRFQAIFLQDENNEAVLQFAVVNLSCSSSIGFTIKRTRQGESSVVNTVNMVPPRKAHTAKSDRATQRTMIVKGKTHADGSAVTVAQDDKEAPINQQGCSFAIAISPEANSRLCHIFSQGTVWKPVRYLVTSLDEPPTLISVPSNEPPGGFMQEGVGFSVPRDAWMRVPSGGVATAFGFSVPQDALAALILSRYPFGDGQLPSESLLYGQSNGLSFGASLSPPNSRGLAATLNSAPSSFGGGFSFGASSSPPILPNSQWTQGRENERKVDVGSTQVADIAFGDKVELRTSFSHVKINEHVVSAPMSLGISIGTFDMDPSHWDMNYNDVVETFTQYGKPIVSIGRVFQSDVCIIDLESPADTIIAQCGHQCVNSKNTLGLKTCPMCRASIVAFILAEEE